jgi:dienelactone hydrolase
VIARAFPAWERRLAAVDTNRRVRPFEWGLDWLGLDDSTSPPQRALADWAKGTLANSDAFFDLPAGPPAVEEGGWLRFQSSVVTPHRENNTGLARVFPADPRPGGPRRAVIVLPQWNSDPGGHVGLCQLLARFGLTAVRLSLPYHDDRKPAGMQRAEFIVSSNIGQTAQINRQAVLDARRVVDWLAEEGFERIGILGTSLGSCLAMLTMTHDPRIRVGAFNHVSPYFADVVWRGLSTKHVREGLEGHVDLDELRNYWMPISPWPFIDRVRGRDVLLVHARYDLTFPVDLSERFVAEFERLEIPHQQARLWCGHYTTGKAPFKFVDGYHLTRFLVAKL